MEIVRHTVLPAAAGRAFGLVDDLAAYPAWMDLVHDVQEVTATDGQRTWDVELQAQVGPFARSKRLRMVRVVCDVPHRVVFERAEVDGRRHSPWVLAATLDPAEAARDTTTATTLTMTLTYGGSLWTGAVLQRVLDEHVERGAATLRALLAASDEPEHPE